VLWEYAKLNQQIKDVRTPVLFSIQNKPNERL